MQLVSRHCRKATHESSLSCNTSGSLLQVAKRGTKRSTSLFFFLIGNQIYSADITLRIKVVISNLKQFATQRSCLTLSFSPYKALKVSEFFMLTYNCHKNFQLPDRATRIWNLVAPMKFLVAPRASGQPLMSSPEYWCLLTAFGTSLLPCRAIFQTSYLRLTYQKRIHISSTTF